MRCPYCGSEMPASARFCTVCGKAPVRKAAPSDAHRTARPAGAPTNRAPARRAKRRSLFLAPNERWNPKFLAACAIILALIILIPILIAAAVHRHTDEPLESRAIQSFYSKASGKTSIVFCGKTYEKAIMGKIASVSVSEDGLKEAVLTDRGSLYYVTSSRLESVANNVLSYELSADGERLCYVIENVSAESSSTDTAETTEEATTKAARLADETTEEETTEYVPSGGEQYLTYLDTSCFLYIGADGSAPLVANHVSPESISISPTGAYVGYAVTAEDGESFEGFMYNNGTTKSMGKDAVPLAFTDDGLQQFYLQYERLDETWVQKLFARSGETEIKLGEFTDGKRFCAFFNRTFTEIVFSFSGSEGAFFHWKDGADKVKLANGYTPICRRGAHVVKDGRAQIVPLDTFAKTAFVRADGAVQYIDGKIQCTDTGAVGKSFRITPDGKTVYFLDAKGTLNACVVRKSDTRTVATNVMNYDLSADGSIVYYVNTDNELHVFVGGKDTRAAENVYAPGDGLCVTDGGYLYFLENYTYGNGTLCYMKGAGKVRVLSDINDVHDIAADTQDNIYYRGNYGTISGTYDLYYGRQKKYTILFKDMG